jgi:hypothetical protein
MLGAFTCTEPKQRCGREVRTAGANLTFVRQTARKQTLTVAWICNPGWIAGLSELVEITQCELMKQEGFAVTARAARRLCTRAVDASQPSLPY